MYRRSSVNMNELINRFEPPEDDFDMAENVKYVKVIRPQGKLYPVHNEHEEATYDDENSLIKYNDKYFNRNKKRNIGKMTNAKEITKQTVAIILSRISSLLEMVSKFPFPRMSVMSFGLTSLLAIFICPRSFTERALYPGFKILFSVIYPAYRSFKAVRNKNLKEYLRWIVYWIVYAFLTCIELMTDAIMSWFPFYFEIKVITFIWLLGPSSRGAMKIYKTCIHPMLITREQEIDDIIQIAQDRGYMHVFRLGSKSVNYANRIIMQEAKTTPDNNLIVSHQLMKNISLSNLSDVDKIQSNDDTDDAQRLRKFSSDKIPLYGNQFNYTYEHLEQHRKSSIDYRCDEISSGYSSPDSPSHYRRFPLQSQNYYIEEHDGDETEMYYRNLSRNHAHSNQSERNSRQLENVVSDAPRRKASINDRTEDEIIFGYNKRRAEQKSTSAEATTKNEDLSSEMKEEFLKWMEMKQKTNSSLIEKSAVRKSEKVNEFDEIERPEDVVNVVKIEHEKSTSNFAIEPSEAVSDFDEFKDVVSDDDDDEYLKVPLVICEEREDIDKKQVDDMKTSNDNQEVDKILQAVIESNETNLNCSADSEQITIDARITLSNAPLEVVVTSLSSSNLSLTPSDKSVDDACVKRRPANHSKGRAPPPPPPLTTTTTAVIPGYFYDHVTKNHFKETEL